jgi:hypothetical protein
METCEYGKFRYSSDEAILDVSYSALDGMIHAYLFSTRETSFQTLHTPEGEVLCLNGVPIAAESYPALLQLVEAENSKATHPLLTLFPRMAHRGAASVQRRSLLQAARWYASALELHRERLSGEFGFVPAFLPAQVAQPSWGGRMSGLHLRDDARLYRLRAGLGQGQLQLKCYSRKDLRKHTTEIGPDSEGQPT